MEVSLSQNQFVDGFIVVFHVFLQVLVIDCVCIHKKTQKLCFIRSFVNNECIMQHLCCRSDEFANFIVLISCFDLALVRNLIQVPLSKK